MFRPTTYDLLAQARNLVSAIVDDGGEVVPWAEEALNDWIEASSDKAVALVSVILAKEEAAAGDFKVRDGWHRRGQAKLNSAQADRRRLESLLLAREEAGARAYVMTPLGPARLVRTEGGGCHVRIG